MEIDDSWKEKLTQIEEHLGYRFTNQSLMRIAFTHASLVNESQSEEISNQRLEFLGDALLGAIVAEYLFSTYPEMNEGQMTQLRAKLVDHRACCAFAKNLDVVQYMRTGRGEKTASHTALLADLFEAIVGAIFIDGGYTAAREFVRRHCLKDVNSSAQNGPQTNEKSKLQTLSQRQYQQVPEYVLISMGGPSHRLEFSVSVSIGGRVLGTGNGRSKKQAEERAARAALEQFNVELH